jgi:hypothetical protein
MRTALKARRRLAGELVPYEADAIAWLDAFSLLDDGLINGDPVETWTSRINPATGSASQAILASRPTLSTDVDATGTPGVVFDGLAHFLELGAVWKQAPSGPWTQYVVVRRSSTASSWIFGWASATRLTGGFYHQMVTTTQNNFQVGANFSGNLATGFSSGQRKIIALRNDASPAGYNASIDDVDYYTLASSTAPGLASATSPTLSARWTDETATATGLRMQGTIQSVLTYGVAHDATQRTAVIAFLEARYAV